MVDTEKSSWRKLLREFEEEGHTDDLSINCHELQKMGDVSEKSRAPSINPSHGYPSLQTWGQQHDLYVLAREVKKVGRSPQNLHRQVYFIVRCV